MKAYSRQLFFAVATAGLWAAMACRPADVRPPLQNRFPEPAVSSAEARIIEDPEAEPLLESSIIQDVPATPTILQAGTVIELSLEDVLRTTLANNLDVRIQELNRQIARDGVTGAEGIYDVVSRISSGYNKFLGGSTDRAAAGNPFTGTVTREVFANASLTQLFPTGGALTLAYDLFNANRRSTGAVFGPAHTESDIHEAALRVIQPLLKNFGKEVTEAGINIAKINADISYEAFRAELIAQLANAQKSYWNLVFAINNYDVQKLAVAQAEDLLRINQVKFDVGVLPKTDVLQAQAQVAQRKSFLIQSEQLVHNVQDELKSAMNLARTAAEWQTQIIPKHSPAFAEAEYDEEACIRIALENRPEIIQTNLARDIGMIDLAVADNQKRPELNLVASGGYVSPDSTDDYDYDNYSVGLEFQFPLQNRKARAAWEQAQASLEAQEIYIEKTAQAITQQIRASLREIRTARERIDINQTAVEFERANLDSEKERFSVGASTSFQVLQFQEDFARAQVNYLQSITEYNKARIDLEAAQGTLLESSGVKIADYGLSIAAEGPAR
jgi:outer membrane protein